MDKGWWIVCGVLTFVIFLNLGLVFSALRYRKSNPQPIFGKSIAEMLNPWKDEDQALEELEQQVKTLTRKEDLPNDG